MNKFKIVGLVTLLFISSFCLAFSQGFAVSYSDSHKNMTIQNEMVKMQSQWVSPSIQPAISSDDWKYISRIVAYDVLSGIPGHRTTDVFTNRDIEIERQVWVSVDRKVVALRQKITNIRKKPFSLNTMEPLVCRGSELFKLKENPVAENWYVHAQKRLKNGFPETVIPKGDVSITADPFLAIPVVSDPNGPVLLVGYLDWTKHLANMEISFENKGGKTEFKGLSANCDFNGVSVHSNDSRTTQWIYISTGPDFVTTVDDYADRVAKYHSIQEPPKNAPSVFCSWYWYGLHYTEEYFLRDLQDLKNLKNRKPFDVFLIDESWGLHLWGDFTHSNSFPGGMKHVADKIKELGYIPGIWTPPYLVSPKSELVKKHPEWVLKTSKGDHYTFRMNDEEHLVIDPTYPGVLDHLEESFRKLSEDWGFEYFKFDFMRAVFMEGDYAFFDAQKNRLEAYRMGLEAIRRGVGDDAYISVCGGHYGGSLGLADTQRSGSDVVSHWNENEIQKYRQNILRTWMGRLWHVDPDAMMVRRNEKSEFPDGPYAPLSLGLFSDNEVQVNALNQYIGGGLVVFAENYASLDEDRLELYKHIIPSINSPSSPIDWYVPDIPSMVVTHVSPVCQNLENWNTVAIFNWTEEAESITIDLNNLVLKSLPGEQFVLFEFFSQEVKGIFKKDELVHMGTLDPRSGLLLKVIPWDGQKPVLAGTDLHFSMGGMEIKEWKFDIGSVEGVVETDWLYPVRITSVFPALNIDGFISKQVVLQPNQKRFWLVADEK